MLGSNNPHSLIKGGFLGDLQVLSKVYTAVSSLASMTMNYL